MRETGADALHPGYGFMSENADFAAAVQELELEGNTDTDTDTSCNNGNDDNDNNDSTTVNQSTSISNLNRKRRVAWLGPPAQAIRDMGCKIRSKEIAKHAGVAIIPGYGGGGNGDNDDDAGTLDTVEDALEIMKQNNNNNNNNSNHNNKNSLQTQAQFQLLRYPVLLKAAAGGGGKGMRICRTDQELIEGFPLAQSEGLKFFKDERLLLEQYLEHPHHIEFQIVCSKVNSNTTTDVAIFVERECSIQRRNQKIIEESPSCVLTADTRRQMMEQTVRLCQNVGYEGAGTVEWLVVNTTTNNHDEKENSGGHGQQQPQQQFYFLEMNTRLQVEHPVTEAVSCNIDFVEAMLRVGAGQGLPPQWYQDATVVEKTEGGGKMLLMPWKGHAIEARIYAEDPMRGYLPSTGPLVPYKEPIDAITIDDGTSHSRIGCGRNGHDEDSSYLRLDSGVVEGHVVTPFYDPMLSKIIAYAPTTRQDAIRVLSEGLDQYVIAGVRHNARLVQAVLRHPAFQQGETPTSFLDTHMPDFQTYSIASSSSLSLLTETEEEELAVAVAVISKARETLFERPPLVSGKSSVVVVRLNGMFEKDNDDHGASYRITVLESSTNNNSHTAQVCRLNSRKNRNSNANESSGSRLDTTNDDPEQRGERVVTIDHCSLDLPRYLAHITLDGMARTIQVLNEAQSGALKVQMYGAEYPHCLVQSPREYELSQYLRPPIVEDTSDFVMSPMPGTLLAFSSDNVHKGDFVELGQELCVVEAMKMQNIIRAPRAGIIKKVHVATGDALVTDQVLMEFLPEEKKT